MCGRYRLTLSWQELAELLSLRVPDPGWSPRWNIAPTQPVLTLTAGEAGTEARLLRWGFTPSWSKRPLINARAEDAAAKRTWSKPLERRRCLVPADGFYEWRRDGRAKQPFDFSAGLVTFAGLWDRFPGEDGPQDCVTILTRAAGPEVQPVHGREPAVVTPERRAAWLDPAPSAPEERLALLERAPDFQFEVRPVSDRVNSARNQGAQVLEYLDAARSL